MRSKKAVDTVICSVRLPAHWILRSEQRLGLRRVTKQPHFLRGYLDHLIKLVNDKRMVSTQALKHIIFYGVHPQVLIPT